MNLYPSILSAKDMRTLEQRRSYIKYDGACPTCGGTGTYTFNGKEYTCATDEDGFCIQLKLHRFYELANIPAEFQTFDWEGEFNNQHQVADDIRAYIDNLDSIVKQGTGLTLYSKGLGTGKTASACHVLKNLVRSKNPKSGQYYRGYYIGFLQLMDLYHEEDATDVMKRLIDADIIVIDDVMAGRASERQSNYFSSALERVIRKRCDDSTPTIVTTNLEPPELELHYDRIFSLLSNRNIQIKLDALDARRQSGAEPRAIRAMSQETMPIR